MQKQALTTKGFGLVGLLIVVMALAIVGGGGAYVYGKNHKAKTSVNSGSATNTTSKTGGSTSGKAATTADLYAGWNSYITKYDKISFKYPAAWTLADNSNTRDTDITPGEDSVTLTSNDGLQVLIGTGGTEFDGGNSSVKVLSSTPINTLGETHYLVFATSTSGSVTAGAVVTTANALPSISNLPPSKNITLSNPKSGLPAPFDLINLEYSGTEGSSGVGYSLSKFQGDPNYRTAFEILESLSY